MALLVLLGGIVDTQGNLFHMMWGCLVIQDNWSQAVQFRHDKMDFLNPDVEKYRILFYMKCYLPLGNV